MADHIKPEILSYGRAALGDGSESNKQFLTCLFSDKDLGIQFLKDVGLLRSKVTCNILGCDMTWWAEPKLQDNFIWRCRRRRSASVFCASTSVMYVSWFQQGNLTFQEVMFLTTSCAAYLPTISNESIASVPQLSLTMVSSAEGLCWRTSRAALRESAILRRPSKSTRSKFDRRKYHRDNSVKGQWVFEGAERKSGKTSLFSVPDGTAGTLMAVIDSWIEPTTTVISDCWAAYRDLDAQGYTHSQHRLRWSVYERTYQHHRVYVAYVKAFLSPENRKRDYIYHLAHYMFTARCTDERAVDFA